MARGVSCDALTSAAKPASKPSILIVAERKRATARRRLAPIDRLFRFVARARYSGAMDRVIASGIELLGVAMAVAIVARRLRLPYTVGLVATGLALALARLPLDLALTHDVLFEVILPPLLFEAALSISWRELRRDLAPVLALSTVGVLLGAGVVAGGLVWALDWPLAPALAFGALIAATDPIAVIAMLREAGVKGRLRLVIESESLFNDGAAALLFALILPALSQSGAPTPLSIAAQALLIGGGGIAIGAAVGALAIALAGRTDDHLVETALTAVVAYGSFLIAERIGASGVLATVAAGLVMGNLGGLGAERRPLRAERAGTAVGRRVLGVRRLRRQFAGVPADRAGDGRRRDARRRVRRRRDRDRRRAGARRPRRDRLSDRARLRPHALGVRLARSAFPVVERAARRAGAGAGAGAAARSALPRRDSRRRFRRRRVLGSGAGPHRRAGAARAAARREEAAADAEL